MGNITTVKTQMDTLLSCSEMLNKLGFTTQFVATSRGLKSLSTNCLYSPDEIKVLNFYRFEEETNPSDNAILYAIETSIGERGTLVDAYGSESDSDVSNFMHDVINIHKKVNPDETL